MEKENKRFLGSAYYVENGWEMENEFNRIAKEDEEAADCLRENGFYNQAVYYYIQSMEKYVKSVISSKINVNNSIFAKQIRETGHSLEKSVDLLIEVIAGNQMCIREQISSQIKHVILQDVRFSGIYNAVRYPYYMDKNDSYRIVRMTEADCRFVRDIYQSLKVTLRELYRIK